MTQHYFKNHRVEWLASADAYIASTCLTYLFFSAFADGLCHSYRDRIVRLADHQLVAYAAIHWGHYTRKAQAEVKEQALQFLTELQPLRSTCQLEYWLGGNTRLAFDASAVHSGLHCAARLGLSTLIARLVRRLPSMEEKDRLGRTPLSYAAEEGH
jgi:hypothetical protein